MLTREHHQKKKPTSKIIYPGEEILVRMLFIINCIGLRKSLTFVLCCLIASLPFSVAVAGLSHVGLLKDDRRPSTRMPRGLPEQPPQASLLLLCQPALAALPEGA
ncbi:hypothetical protein TNCV_4462121 [Trichonephila clavipes]|nr:hypothetical protein TNCV_4462121 [Trichonephila clavipes]